MSRFDVEEPLEHEDLDDPDEDEDDHVDDAPAVNHFWKSKTRCNLKIERSNLSYPGWPAPWKCPASSEILTSTAHASSAKP